MIFCNILNNNHIAVDIKYKCFLLVLFSILVDIIASERCELSYAYIRPPWAGEKNKPTASQRVQLTRSYLMSGDQQTQCESCDVPLTMHHIITECEEYNRERLVHLGRARPVLKTVLASQTNYYGGPLYNFISSTQ